MDRLKLFRNLLILALIAAGVEFLPGGGRAADTFGSVLSVAFAVGLGYAALWAYRQHRVSIYGLGDRHRALLYGAVGVLILMLAGRTKMFETGFGEFAWFVLMGLSVYTLFAVYRFSRTY